MLEWCSRQDTDLEDVVGILDFIVQQKRENGRAGSQPPILKRGALVPATPAA